MKFTVIYLRSWLLMGVTISSNLLQIVCYNEQCNNYYVLLGYRNSLNEIPFYWKKTV